MSHVDSSALSQYNSLSDPHLSGHFSNLRMRRHLKKAGLIDKRGDIVSENTYRLNMARKEHKKHVREMLAQAIVHKTLDMERGRQVTIRKKLEEIAKHELVKRVRSDRGRKGDEDILPLLSPNAKTRPASAYTGGQQGYGSGGAARPKSAPASRSRSRKRSKSPGSERLVAVDDQGMPLSPRDSIASSAGSSRRGSGKPKYPRGQIDDRHLYSLDQHTLREYRNAQYTIQHGRGPTPYLWAQPGMAPSPSPGRSPRAGSGRRGASGLDSNGRPLRPKNNTGSLLLHRQEPAMKHRTQLHTGCQVTIHYFGNALRLSGETFDPRHEVTVEQQHCGGNTLHVFRDKILPGSDFTFESRRHRGFPFGLTFYINGLEDCRLSACCEYKHSKGAKLGGKKGHFGIVSVSGASPCYKCQIAEEMRKQEQQKNKKKKKKQVGGGAAGSDPDAEVDVNSNGDDEHAHASRGIDTERSEGYVQGVSDDEEEEQDEDRRKSDTSVTVPVSDDERSRKRGSKYDDDFESSARSHTSRTSSRRSRSRSSSSSRSATPRRQSSRSRSSSSRSRSVTPTPRQDRSRTPSPRRDRSRTPSLRRSRSPSPQRGNNSRSSSRSRTPSPRRGRSRTPSPRRGRSRSTSRSRSRSSSSAGRSYTDDARGENSDQPSSDEEHVKADMKLNGRAPSNSTSSSSRTVSPTPEVVDDVVRSKTPSPLPAAPTYTRPHEESSDEETPRHRSTEAQVHAQDGRAPSNSTSSSSSRTVSPTPEVVDDVMRSKTPSPLPAAPTYTRPHEESSDEETPRHRSTEAQVHAQAHVAKTPSPLPEAQEYKPPHEDSSNGSSSQSSESIQQMYVKEETEIASPLPEAVEYKGPQNDGDAAAARDVGAPVRVKHEYRRLWEESTSSESSGSSSDRSQPSEAGGSSPHAEAKVPSPPASPKLVSPRGAETKVPNPPTSPKSESLRGAAAGARTSPQPTQQQEQESDSDTSDSETDTDSSSDSDSEGATPAVIVQRLPSPQSSSVTSKTSSASTDSDSSDSDMVENRDGVTVRHRSGRVEIEANNNITEDKVQALCDIIKECGHVTSLTLRNTDLNDASLARVKEVLLQTGETDLRVLNLSHNRLTDIQDILAIVTAKTDLVELNLHGNRFNKTEELISGLAGIHRLRLSDEEHVSPERLEEVRKQAASVIADIMPNMAPSKASSLTSSIRGGLALRALDLGGCNVTTTAAQALADFLQSRVHLRKLVLSGNTAMEHEGVAALAAALRENTQLRSLSLDYCRLQQEGVEALAEALKENTHLEELDLEMNYIGKRGAKALMEMLQVNTSLKSLDIARGNEISESDLALMKANLKPKE